MLMMFLFKLVSTSNNLNQQTYTNVILCGILLKFLPYSRATHLLMRVACRAEALGGHVECYDQLQRVVQHVPHLPLPVMPATLDTLQGRLVR